MESKKYNYVSTAIREVMNNIEEFVIPENREAIEYLWDKNILTTQTNNYNNTTSFICIGDLSEENETIFWDAFNSRILNYDKREPVMGAVYGGKGIEIPVVPGSGNTFDYFKPFIDRMVFQDVQKDGYMTVPEFFIKYTDCWEMVSNPDYRLVPKPKMEEYENKDDYFKAYDQYISSQVPPRRIRVFAEEKMAKSLEDYLKEYGFSDCYDPEEQKIYYHPRLLEGHLRYKEYQQSLRK